MNPEALQNTALDTFRNLKDSGTRCCGDLEAKIRENPLPTVGLAALVALFFPFGVVTAILGVLLRLGFFLLRPAILILGIWKSVELFQSAQSAPAPTGEGVSPGPDAPPPGL